MKNFVIEAFQFLLALLITGSLASAAQLPTKSITVTPKAAVASNKAVSAAIKPEPIKPPIQVQTPPEAPQTAPVPALTDHQKQLQAAGIAESDWNAVDYIVSHESGWCPTKWEGEIGVGCPDYHGYSAAGYGMCQSTPAIKMSLEGSGWETDPVIQLKWCNSYAQARYGGWWPAYYHWQNNHNW